MSEGLDMQYQKVNYQIEDIVETLTNFSIDIKEFSYTCQLVKVVDRKGFCDVDTEWLFDELKKDYSDAYIEDKILVITQK